MPTKVAVNIEQLTINDGSSFLVTARDGSIKGSSRDTDPVGEFKNQAQDDPDLTNLSGC